LTILAVLVVLPAGAALADDDCLVPMADWQTREAVTRMAEANGWTVRRIKVDDGCYEIDGRDGSGRRIEVTDHPETLQVIDSKYENADGNDDDDVCKADPGARQPGTRYDRAGMRRHLYPRRTGLAAYDKRAEGFELPCISS